MTSEGDAKFAKAKIEEKLIGGQIVGTIEDPTEGSYGYGIVVENKGTIYHCWIDCDPEGNGPGFMNAEVAP